jgi:hypothetical protein
MARIINKSIINKGSYKMYYFREGSKRIFNGDKVVLGNNYGSPLY